MIKFSGVAAGEACTVVLRGATNQLLDESERSLHDALSVLSQTTQEPRTVLGGGCSEVLMSKAVDEVAAKTAGKQQAAIEAFSRALRQMPPIFLPFDFMISTSRFPQNHAKSSFPMSPLFAFLKWLSSPT